MAKDGLKGAFGKGMGSAEGGCAGPVENATVTGVLERHFAGECSRVVVFEEGGKVVSSTCEISAREVGSLCRALEDRTECVKAGFAVAGTRFEVHRWHPPLVYGREGGDEGRGEGIALIKSSKTSDGTSLFTLITYKLPNLSARMVPKLQTMAAELAGVL